MAGKVGVTTAKVGVAKIAARFARPQHPPSFISEYAPATDSISVDKQVSALRTHY